jgi:hypothetical protein
MVNFGKAPVIDSKLALLLIRTVVDATSDGKAPSNEDRPALLSMEVMPTRVKFVNALR